jgi:molybdate transport system ATP-binding protein
MIEIKIRHRVGAFAIAADIVAQGRMLALCGPSGVGKTTLLNLIAGLARPERGRIAIDGAVHLDTARGIDAPTRARRLGYVFQEPRLFPHLNVEANLNYGARFAPSTARLVGFDDVVALLGIAPLLERRPARLSGGEKQRVAIGRALLMSPRALLLDEPLTAIDDARRHEILGLIETLRDTFAIPMIFVSHRPDEVERLASDIAVLSPGRPVEMRAGALATRSMIATMAAR